MAVEIQNILDNGFSVDLVKRMTVDELEYSASINRFEEWISYIMDMCNKYDIKGE